MQKFQIEVKENLETFKHIIQSKVGMKNLEESEERL
jgi:hypothetical protein